MDFVHLLSHPHVGAGIVSFILLSCSGTRLAATPRSSHQSVVNAYYLLSLSQRIYSSTSTPAVSNGLLAAYGSAATYGPTRSARRAAAARRDDHAVAPVRDLRDVARVRHMDCREPGPEQPSLDVYRVERGLLMQLVRASPAPRRLRVEESPTGRSDPPV